MKELEDRKRFIDMRSDDMSLAKIAQKLHVSRQTLANWEKVHEEEIWRLQSMKLDALEEEFSIKRLGRIELYGTMLRRVKEELERRDLSDVQTAKLFDLQLKLIPELKKLFSITPLMSDQEVGRMMLMRDRIEHPWTEATPNPPRRTPIPTLKEGDGGDDDSDEQYTNPN